MRILLIIFLQFLSLAIFAQDTIRIKHTNYTTVFSKSKKYPVLVEWWETRNKVGCENPLPRKDNFKPDPMLLSETSIGSDYINSGFDRGHMMPAKSNQCQTQSVQDECFYYSNMSAQYHSLNAGDWKTLESLTREMAKKIDSVHIWAGNFGEIKKIGSVSVPTHCWKVVYYVKSKTWDSFLFENNKSKPDGVENNRVSLEKIENITGFKFR